MFIRSLNSEKIKIQWYFLFLLIICETLINSFISFIALGQNFSLNWKNYYTYSANFHSMFFFPLLAGLFTTLLYRYEHNNSNWKNILTASIPKHYIYLSKMIWVFLFLIMTQLFFFLSYSVVGQLLGVEGTLPLLSIFKSLGGGIIAIIPLLALQSWISIYTKNFGASLVIVLGLIIPNLLLTGMRSNLGSWFPSTIPFYTMMPQGTQFSPRVDFLSLYIIIAITSIVYILSGTISFRKREW
ncbi:ABC transporter permease [Lysinibacillus pakistanensis]|uniref:Lantibiotic ABC transporter permease n=1 Tax=Lysinibacillus pakistanensis TaxID=759811 RepID=A0ABX6DCL5_9BACI|nr:lantibiotic ABC transporter permease [Lysinibacillus pakistanensis]